MAAAGLPKDKRRRAIVLGLGLAVVLLSGFALIAVQLLKVIGLLIAGGLLLAVGRLADVAGAEVPPHRQHRLGAPEPAANPKTLLRAMVQILIADISMSLDNVLAVAGAARDHPWVLVFGLLLSITLTGFAAMGVARLLQKALWIGYVGLASWSSSPAA